MPYISKQKAIKYGYDNPNIQTIQVPKKLGSVDRREEIQKLLSDNGYLFKNWRETKNFYRFIQNEHLRCNTPKELYVIIDANYFSKKLPNGIIITYQKF